MISLFRKPRQMDPETARAQRLAEDEKRALDAILRSSGLRTGKLQVRHVSGDTPMAHATYEIKTPGFLHSTAIGRHETYWLPNTELPYMNRFYIKNIIPSDTQNALEQAIATYTQSKESQHIGKIYE
jgi:hypothetical protein